MTLLPPNAEKQERDIEATIERLGNVPVPIDKLWNANTCPVELLPWLAWAFSVDYWVADWTEAQKREVIKQSIAVHRIKGTYGAVKKALEATGNHAIIKERNIKPSLDPYTFDVAVEVENAPVTEIIYQQALDTVERTKNVRSHLADFRVPGTVRGLMNIASAILGGDMVSVLPYLGETDPVTGPLYVGMCAMSYETISVYPA